MKKFLGFTPDQASILLQAKGYKPNSREGAEYLAGMHDKAQSMVGGQTFQMGGQVSGFDPQSQKLFDAAVKRVSGNQPQTPEVQRYLDNVIETRGRPTMVFPNTADPLQDAMPQQGFMSGGLSSVNTGMEQLRKDNEVKRNILIQRVKENADFGGGKSTYDLIEKIPFLKSIAEDHYLKVLANDLDNSISRDDMPYSNRLFLAGKDPQTDHELYRELLSFADEKYSQGMQEPKDEVPLYKRRLEEEVTRKNKELMKKHYELRSPPRPLDPMNSPKLSEPSDSTEDQRLYEESLEYQRQKQQRENEEFRRGSGYQEGGVVNPYPTTTATGTAPRDSARDNLNKAQADLAAEQQKLSDLRQQLAQLPTDASQDAKRQEIVNQISAQDVNITQKQAAVSSASQSFQSVGIPTAAEAVGTTVSTPSDLATRQQVNLLEGTTDQLIPTGTGQLPTNVYLGAREGTVGQGTATPQMPTLTPDATKATQAVRDEQLTKTTGTLSQDAIANAQTIEQSELAIRDVKAAQDDSTIQVVSPAKRQLQQGEIVSGVANAEVAKTFLEGVEAATGAPSSQATVQGQLTSLMTQFEGGEPPPWASGAMRQATAVMAQRGLAASSMAGQAIVQAAMESALPIAMQDAQTVAQFEAQNLSNRQQRAMLSAQQRAQFLGMEFDQGFQARVKNTATISDIANRNFSSEVQIALENAQLAQTTDLTNLGNKQAVVMAQAAAISQADMTNLNNRQQTEVRNAQAFLQMDMTNFNAEQQVDMFANQSIIQGLFSDTAAENAMAQFNATSENQANQFFSKLDTQVSEFNASQRTAMEQFNAGEVNALTKFQQELSNQRDQFNARNELVIAQANAQWRQQLTTINNASQNEANRQDALQSNALTQKGLDEIWQRERDLMAYAFTSAENAEQRRLELVKAELNVEAGEDTAFSTALGSFAGAVVNGIFDVQAAKAGARFLTKGP